MAEVILEEPKKVCSICKQQGEFRNKNKMCNSCIDKNKCPHGKQRRLCRDCGGTAYCKHGIRKEYCPDESCDGGSGLCEHKNRKDVCRLCPDAKAFCEHKKLKYSCIKCGTGSQICIHNHRKETCRECGGKRICPHDLIIDNCRECKGCHICEHGNRRATCVQCDGSMLCIHKKPKYDCSICKLPSKFCEHGIRRRTCKECKGDGLCPHMKQKAQCVLCTPTSGCQNCHMYYVPKTYRFHPYCFGCYCVLHPDAEIPKRYKIKENHVRDYLKAEFPDITLVFDKPVEDGCSQRRPDVRIDMGEYTIVAECDENQHKGYTCETKRVMEIFQDCGSRPLVVLRFNPDSYHSTEPHKSCFSPTKNGLSVDVEEFTRRMKVVAERIRYYKNHLPEKEVTVEQFFYTI